MKGLSRIGSPTPSILGPAPSRSRLLCRLRWTEDPEYLHTSEINSSQTGRFYKQIFCENSVRVYMVM